MSQIRQLRQAAVNVDQTLGGTILIAFATRLGGWGTVWFGRDADCRRQRPPCGASSAARRQAGALAAVLVSLSVAALSSGAPVAFASTEQTFQVLVGGHAFTTSLPANSVGTFVWHPGSNTVESWITTPEAAEAHEGVLRQPNSSFSLAVPGLQTITVSPETEFQEVDGFGAAMTESAAYVLRSSANGQQALEKLFAPPPTGAGLSIARIPIGPSDFTVKAKKPTEYSEAQDEKYVMPELKEASRIAEDLKILATPWSAPGSMKIGKKLVGSKVCTGSNDRLQKADLGAYAAYLTKATANYQEKGLPFWMLSLQNEPRNCNATYPTMEMGPEEEAGFSNVLYNELHRVGNGLISSPPKLLGWDHNWDECNSDTPTTYPEELLAQPNHVEALGFHSYCNGEAHEPAGVPSSMPYYVTESTGFETYPSPSQNLPNEVGKDLIDPLRVGAKGSLYWNMALDECGPTFGGGTSCTKSSSKYTGCTNCRPMVRFNKKGVYKLEQDYFYWAQLSEFIRPGARIVESSIGPELDTIAAKNTDGGVVLTVLNGSTRNQNGAIIKSGKVGLGVNVAGALNVSERELPSAKGVTVYGLRYLPTNDEFAGPGCPCEGWGIGDPADGVAGYADEATGTAGLNIEEFAATKTTATSTVGVGSTFKITNAYQPVTGHPDLYEDRVTITNVSEEPVDEVLYRRLVDWDMEPTEFDEYVTNQGYGGSPELTLDTDDGFGSADPLSTPESLGAEGNFYRYGPFDQGTSFDFNFGTLAPRASTSFTEYYGAAANQAEAYAELESIGAEAYSLGAPNIVPSEGGALGEPNVAVLAFTGIGGPVAPFPTEEASEPNSSSSAAVRQRARSRVKLAPRDRRQVK
jgi:O-glycosyl hydrolase